MVLHASLNLHLLYAVVYNIKRHIYLIVPCLTKKKEKKTTFFLFTDMSISQEEQSSFQTEFTDMFVSLSINVTQNALKYKTNVKTRTQKKKQN